MKNLHIQQKPAAIALCALWLGSTGYGQSASISVSPVNATVSVGQTQQFAVSGAVTPTGVSAGGEYTCVGLSDGTVRCTGRNQFQQLADGTVANSPVLVASTLTNIRRVAAGDEYACALGNDGTAACWGLGESGQRGDGTFTTFSAGPAIVPGVSGATALASGYSHTCALLADATMQCWGRNLDGELGTGVMADPSGPPGTATPVAVNGVSNAVAIATGAYHTCAVRSDGTVQCWGLNGNAQLGDGTFTNSATPLTVAGLSTATAVTGGAGHTCALLRDGTVMCWGDNECGQLGDGTQARGLAPVQVVGINNAVAVTAGWLHTCAVLSDGGVMCWGDNAYGQLGNGSTTSSSAPVRVNGITRATAATAGWWHHSCALLGDTSVRCWGANEWGQRGDGTTTSSTLPSSVTGSGVTWTSSDSTVATVDPTGLAVAINSGAATILATDTSGANASATFTVRQRAALSVLVAGAGAGRVTAAPAGIDCGVDCSELYDVGTTVTLAPTPDSRSTFAGWIGCDSVAGTTCTITVNAATTVRATFDLKRFTLTTAKAGIAASQGRVTSSPQGVDCGADCSEVYTIDTVVTLTASPDLLFSGWSGCDAVSGTTCTVRMSAARNVTANFVTVPF
jgi:alpha-tubulin suppressor-like RCC1 family protein